MPVTCATPFHLGRAGTVPAALAAYRLMGQIRTVDTTRGDQRRRSLTEAVREPRSWACRAGPPCIWNDRGAGQHARHQGGTPRRPHRARREGPTRRRQRNCGERELELGSADGAIFAVTEAVAAA